MSPKSSVKKRTGKLTFCASGYSHCSKAQLPFVYVDIMNVRYKALVDTGCSRTIVSRKVSPLAEESTCENVTMMDGSIVPCYTKQTIELSIKNMKIQVACLVMDVLNDYELLLGMDAIKELGGVTIDERGAITFGKSWLDCNTMVKTIESNSCKVAVDDTNVEEIVIDDTDFVIVFREGHWKVEWKWQNAKEPVISPSPPNYRIPAEYKEKFENEIESWIKNNWLIEYDGEIKGSLPLMAVYQEHKDKVRPVMDFKKLNEFVTSHTGDSVVCGETLKKWRKMGNNLSILDLKNAYLQIHVDEKLWPFQVVKFKDKTYCLTRLGFGLNVAPKVMTRIVDSVLSVDHTIRIATDSYIDDIIVNEDVTTAENVKSMLSTYGLICKEAETIKSTRILGLRTFVQDDEVKWKRDDANFVKEAIRQENLTKKDIFSICGKLIGHFPICNWLRPYCAYIKRMTNDNDWKDVVDCRVGLKLLEVLTAVQINDPVGGNWYVSGDRCKVWCDASALAIGVAVSVDDNIIEDATWLRGKGDVSHINLAELEATIKGVNAAVKWGFKRIEIMTDSATVCSWLSTILHNDKKVKVSGLSEVLVKRRLELLSDLFRECELQVEVELVRSQANKADVLTRVPKKWLLNRNVSTAAVSVNQSAAERNRMLVEVHNKFHGGLKKTAYVANKIHPEQEFDNEEVKNVTSICEKCLSIDPNPVKWQHGQLSCSSTWKRIAIDVTHYAEKKYLSIIDCGPSRFTIWRAVRDESVETLTKELDEVFSVVGPPDEVILDNYPSFTCDAFVRFQKRWNINGHYRCVNKPSGNGIGERIHRTIKKMAKRSDSSIANAVFYYNATPNSEGKVPCELFFNRRIRFPAESPKTTELPVRQSDYLVGDIVFVKPNPIRCVDSWKRGKITGVSNSLPTVEVDGVPRHESHVRKVPEESLVTGESDDCPCNRDHVREEPNECQLATNVNVNENNGSWIEIGPRGRPLRKQTPVDRYGVMAYSHQNQ